MIRRSLISSTSTDKSLLKQPSSVDEEEQLPSRSAPSRATKTSLQIEPDNFDSSSGFASKRGRTWMTSLFFGSSSTVKASDSGTRGQQAQRKQEGQNYTQHNIDKISKYNINTSPNSDEFIDENINQHKIVSADEEPYSISGQPNSSSASTINNISITTDLLQPSISSLENKQTSSYDIKDHDNKKQYHQQSKRMWNIFCNNQCTGMMNSTRLMVLLVLCLQNSLFTILRRYSQGVLQENYSKHELLLVAEIIKIGYSAWMISKGLPEGKTLAHQLQYLVETSKKMFVLAAIYGTMNILSFISLRNISAGMFTIFAQCKILTTATFSTIILRRQYSTTKWRALVALMLGVLLFSEPIWGDPDKQINTNSDSNPILGTVAVLVEVTLSGFASIYFEKVIKTDPLKLGIWERNFQLALGSFPIYIMFIIADGGGQVGFFGGWSYLAVILAVLGAAGGLLVALSIKYGDSILKTLATTGAIVLTGILDHLLLGGPLTPAMMIAGLQVIIAICNYSFDATPATASSTTSPSGAKDVESDIEASSSSRTVPSGDSTSISSTSGEMEGLLRRIQNSTDNKGEKVGSDKDGGSPSKRERSSNIAAS